MNQNTFFTHVIAILTALLFCFQSNAQKMGVIEDKVIHFQLEQNSPDSIDFIVVGNEIKKRKPIFLFCQGSLPVPMFLPLYPGEYELFAGGIANFDVDSIRNTYHLVVISMPHTPIIPDSANINRRHWGYIPDPTQQEVFSEAYEKDNYLAKYVERGNKVLSFLKKQDWVDPSKIVLFGHSQGSKVATKMAVENKDITHIGLSGANPIGRIDQYVRNARIAAEEGSMTWEEADQKMERLYALYQDAYNPDSLLVHSYLKGLQTFSEPLIDDWLQLDIPIYLTYGTSDHAATLCDLVPLFFIQEGKTNLTLLRRLGLDHNYFPTKEDGTKDYDKGQWKSVVNDFLYWIASGDSSIK